MLSDAAILLNPESLLRGVREAPGMASTSSLAKSSSSLAFVSIAKAPAATSISSTSTPLLTQFHGLRCGTAALPLKAAAAAARKAFSEDFSFSSIKVGSGLASKGVVTMASQEAGVGVVTTNFRPEGKTVADLLVVGPGVLGGLVAQLWLKGNEGSTVVGQTNTTARHEDLKSVGIVPVVKDDPQHTEKFPYVIFCAPPSGSLDYVGEVRAAAQRWNGEGSLLFTSSSALYDSNDSGVCDEESGPSVPRGRGPRTGKLLDAEDEILKVGGSVVRLAGLYYLLNRGAHTFYLSKGTVDGRPDHTLNLIHYEDAASLCVAILNGESRGQIYMGCDNSPITRQEMMDAVDKSGKFERKFKEFTGVDGPRGKKMYNNLTRKATGWEPKYKSFQSFLGV